MSTVPSFPNFQPDPEKQKRRQAKTFAIPKEGEVIVVEIELSRIDRVIVQNRNRTEPYVVHQYVEAYKANRPIPPIDAVYDPATDCVYLWDGHHRSDALLELKRRTASVSLQLGTIEDAKLLACGANADHGLQRSREDIRRAILFMVRHPVYTKWTDRRIAQHVKCSESTVNEVRKSSGFDADRDQPRERLAVDKNGVERAVTVVPAKRKLKAAEDTARQERLFPALAAAVKSSGSPMSEFLSWAEKKGHAVKTNLDTPIGPIPAYIESLHTIYWIGGCMSAGAALEAAARMRVLRRFMPKRGCRIVIVCTAANLDAQAVMNLASEEFEVAYSPIDKLDK